MREDLNACSEAGRRTAILAILLLCAAGACAQAGSSSEVLPAPAAAPAAQTNPAPASGALPSEPEPNAPSPDAAAAGNGSIFGVVQGKNGEVYAGVHVVLKETGTHPAAPLTQQTDADGQFRFTALPPGAFQLTFSSTGFVTQSISGVLQPGQSYDARNVVLPVANTTSEVRVNATVADIAEAQLHVEETQRVLGFLPNFYVTYDPHAAPLTSRQKFQLAWKSSIDPVNWFMTGVVAGVEQANNTLAGYGQGAQGYGKRLGANYADTFSDNLLAGAVFPSLFKQDPRYFVKGTGSINSRFWYAVANSVICKGDNGHWQANYSGLLGGLATGGVANLYYPSSDRANLSVTFEGAGAGILAGAAQNVAQEFWVRKLTPHFRHGDPGQQ